MNRFAAKKKYQYAYLYEQKIDCALPISIFPDLAHSSCVCESTTSDFFAKYFLCACEIFYSLFSSHMCIYQTGLDLDGPLNM